MLVIAALACAPQTPLDELSGAPRTGARVFAATVSAPAERWVELRFRLDGGAREWRWARAPGPAALPLPPVRYDAALEIAVFVDGSPADPAQPTIAITPGAERGAEARGPVTIAWGGAGAPSLTTVDATPGPGDGWLAPRIPDPGPLRVGISVAEASRSWHVSERAFGQARGVGGLVLVGPVGRSKALVASDDTDAIVSISLMYEAPECAAAKERILLQYGAPQTETPTELGWAGAEVEAGYRARGADCTVFWKRRKLAEP